MAKEIEVLPSRLQFDVLDLLRAARGFDRPEGYAVIPQDILDQIEEEMERLYGIEQWAAELISLIMSETFDLSQIADLGLVVKIRELIEQKPSSRIADEQT